MPDLGEAMLGVLAEQLPLDWLYLWLGDSSAGIPIARWAGCAAGRGKPLPLEMSGEWEDWSARLSAPWVFDGKALDPEAAWPSSLCP